MRRVIPMRGGLPASLSPCATAFHQHTLSLPAASHVTAPRTSPTHTTLRSLPLPLHTLTLQPHHLFHKDAQSEERKTMAGMGCHTIEQDNRYNLEICGEHFPLTIKLIPTNTAKRKAGIKTRSQIRHCRFIHLNHTTSRKFQGKPN